MKVAIVGSRECGTLSVETMLENVPTDASVIISGGADGVDKMAREVAKRLHLPLVEYLPDYKTFGKTAPIVRNRQIVDNADMILAFWDYNSNGTRNTLVEGLKQDKKIKIVMI